MDRRAFFKSGGAILAGASGALSLPVLSSCSPQESGAQSVLAGKRYGMVIDLTRCRPGCTACMDACRAENNVAYHHDDRWDVHWIRKVAIRPEEEVGGLEDKSVILMGDRSSDYGVVVQVLDVCRQVGATTIQMSAEKPPAE